MERSAGDRASPYSAKLSLINTVVLSGFYAGQLNLNFELDEKIVVVAVGRAGHVHKDWSGKGEAWGSFQFHPRSRSNNLLTCHRGMIIINDEL